MIGNLIFELYCGEAVKLKRSGRIRRRYLPVVMTTILVIPLSLAAVRSSLFDLSMLPEQAALLSAMVNMPEGSIELLESRFRDRLDQEYRTQGNESEVEPYLSDWPEEENPDLEPPPPSGQPAPAQPPEEQGPVVTDPSPAKDPPPEIPEEYRGTLLQENMSGTAKNLLRYGAGKLRNYTDEPDDEIVRIMEQGMNITLEQTDAPQVLIFHTHATESYEPYDSDIYDTRNTWRDTDDHNNMVAVGNVLERVLSDAGIGVVHDTTQHDYPSYNGSYERSAETIKSYLEKYPTIKIALDVHRDAIQRESDLIVKPVVEIDGRKAAQLMIITGCEDGTMGVPEWRQNLRFAASLQDAIEQDYPQLTRPIFFCYRKYNMDLTPGSLLLEIGSNANTLEESIYSAELIGSSLAKLLNANREPA